MNLRLSVSVLVTLALAIPIFPSESHVTVKVNCQKLLTEAMHRSPIADHFAQIAREKTYWFQFLKRSRLRNALKNEVLRIFHDFCPHPEQCRVDEIERKFETAVQFVLAQSGTILKKHASEEGSRLTLRGKLLLGVGLFVSGVFVPIGISLLPEKAKLPVTALATLLVPFFIEPLMSTARAVWQAVINQQANHDGEAAAHVGEDFQTALNAAYRKIQGGMDGASRETLSWFNGSDVLISVKLMHAEIAMQLFKDMERAANQVKAAILVMMRYNFLLPNQSNPQATAVQELLFPGWRDSVKFADWKFRQRVRELVLKESTYENTPAVLDQLLGALMPHVQFPSE